MSHEPHGDGVNDARLKQPAGRISFEAAPSVAERALVAEKQDLKPVLKCMKGTACISSTSLDLKEHYSPNSGRSSGTYFDLPIGEVAKAPHLVESSGCNSNKLGHRTTAQPQCLTTKRCFLKWFTCQPVHLCVHSSELEQQVLRILHWLKQCVELRASAGDGMATWGNDEQGCLLKQVVVR